jgi:acetyl esterase/lipase
MTELIRQFAARQRPSRILIFNGPGVDVDATAMRMFAGRFAEELSVELTVVEGNSGDPAGELLAAAEDKDAAIVNPGTARLADVLPAETPTVYVGFSYPGAADAHFDSGPLEDIAGRGIDGYRWAISYLLAACEWPFDIYRYGPERDHVAEWRVPEGQARATVVLIHGGGWKALWRKDIMAAMAVELARRGLASWNIEFRRLGAGGGWPTTFDDVAAAVNALEALPPSARRHVVLVGHSSGAQLALTAARTGNTHIDVGSVVSLSGVLDLVDAHRRELIGGENVVARLIGGDPREFPDRYDAVSPRAGLPLGTPQFLVQGLMDYILDLVDQNRTYLCDAQAVDDAVRLIEIPAAGHLDLIEPSSAAWPAVSGAIDEAVAAAVAATTNSSVVAAADNPLESPDSLSAVPKEASA